MSIEYGKVNIAIKLVNWKMKENTLAPLMKDAKFKLTSESSHLKTLRGEIAGMMIKELLKNDNVKTIHILGPDDRL